MYARDIENIYSGKFLNTSMVVSCMDQIEEYQYISNGKVRTADGKNKFLRKLNVVKGDTIFYNTSPCADTMARQSIIF